MEFSNTWTWRSCESAGSPLGHVIKSQHPDAFINWSYERGNVNEKVGRWAHNLCVRQVYLPVPPTDEMVAADLKAARKEIGWVSAGRMKVQFLTRTGDLWRTREPTLTLSFSSYAYQYNYRTEEEERAWLINMLREREGYSLLRDATNPWTDEHYFPVYTCSAPHDYDAYQMHREVRSHCGFKYCFDSQTTDGHEYLLCAKYGADWPEYAIKMVPREEGDGKVIE
jgi:hypothetical protein